MLLLLNIIIAIFLTEAITELVVNSEIFEPLRKFFFIRRNNHFFKFLHAVTDCDYCFSVWAGWFIAIIILNDLSFILINKYIDWFFVGLFLHRISNILHYVIIYIRSRSENGQGI